MRILMLTDSYKNDEKDISFLEKSLEVKFDFFDNIEDAEYCSFIRDYDIVYLEYKREYHKKYHNILAYLKKENQPKVYIITSQKENLKDFERYEFKEENIDFNLKNHLIETLPNNESEIIKRDNIIININSKTVFYEKDSEMIEVKFEKDFDFTVFLYFIRNYESTINIKNLLNATCAEPEYAKDSLVETSISSIRKTFISMFAINPIKAFKKVGYRFSLQMAV